MKYTTLNQIPCGLQDTPLPNKLSELLPAFAAQCAWDGLHYTCVSICVCTKLQHLSLAIHPAVIMINNLHKNSSLVSLTLEMSPTDKIKTVRYV